MLQLVTTVSNPMVPPEVRSTALKISAATSELIDRIIRTFEQFKDPEIFCRSTPATKSNKHKNPPTPKT
jgi:hypothetical protein